MRSATIFACASLLAGLASAVPVANDGPESLMKRGGYFDSNGKWVDDGYWAWSHGDKKEEFVPWAGSSSPEEKQTNDYQTSSSGGSGYHGTGTYFYQKGNAGACGKVNSDDSYVVALTPSMYAGGSRCGQSISVKNTNNGKQITALVADLCPSCTAPTNVDFSVGAFHALGGTENAGTISIEWSF